MTKQEKPKVELLRGRPAVIMAVSTAFICPALILLLPFALGSDKVFAWGAWGLILVTIATLVLMAWLMWRKRDRDHPTGETSRLRATRMPGGLAVTWRIAAGFGVTLLVVMSLSSLMAADGLIHEHQRTLPVRYEATLSPDVENTSYVIDLPMVTGMDEPELAAGEGNVEIVETTNGQAVRVAATNDVHIQWSRTVLLRDHSPEDFWLTMQDEGWDYWIHLESDHPVMVDLEMSWIDTVQIGTEAEPGWHAYPLYYPHHGHTGVGELIVAVFLGGLTFVAGLQTVGVLVLAWVSRYYLAP